MITTKMDIIERIFPLLKRTEEGKVLPAYCAIDVVEGEFEFGAGPAPEEPGVICLPISPYVTRWALEEFIRDDVEARDIIENLQYEARVLKSGELHLTKRGKELVQTFLEKLEGLEKGYPLEAGEWVPFLAGEVGFKPAFLLIPLNEGEVASPSGEHREEVEDG